MKLQRMVPVELFLLGNIQLLQSRQMLKPELKQLAMPPQKISTSLWPPKMMLKLLRLLWHKQWLILLNSKLMLHPIKDKQTVLSSKSQIWSLLHKLPLQVQWTIRLPKPKLMKLKHSLPLLPSNSVQQVKPMQTLAITSSLLMHIWRQHNSKLSLQRKSTRNVKLHTLQLLLPQPYLLYKAVMVVQQVLLNS